MTSPSEFLALPASVLVIVNFRQVYQSQRAPCLHSIKTSTHFSYCPSASGPAPTDAVACQQECSGLGSIHAQGSMGSKSPLQPHLARLLGGRMVPPQDPG